jgi:hypothetical protein
VVAGQGVWLPFFEPWDRRAPVGDVCKVLLLLLPLSRCHTGQAGCSTYNHSAGCVSAGESKPSVHFCGEPEVVTRALLGHSAL